MPSPAEKGDQACLVDEESIFRLHYFVLLIRLLRIHLPRWGRLFSASASFSLSFTLSYHPFG